MRLLLSAIVLGGTGCGGYCGENPAQILCPGDPGDSKDPSSVRLTPDAVLQRYAHARADFLAGAECIGKGESIHLLPGPAPRLFVRTAHPGDPRPEIESRAPVSLEGDWIVAVGRDEGTKPGAPRMRMGPWEDLRPSADALVLDGKVFYCRR